MIISGDLKLNLPLFSPFPVGLRFPLMWRDSDHFNNRGSMFTHWINIHIFSFHKIENPMLNICCLSFLFGRLSSGGGVLSDADWLWGVWHWHGCGGQICHWHLLWWRHPLVNMLHISYSVCLSGCRWDTVFNISHNLCFFPDRAICFFFFWMTCLMMALLFTLLFIILQCLL